MTEDQECEQLAGDAINSISLTVFRKRLKTFLFRNASLAVYEPLYFQTQ